MKIYVFAFFMPLFLLFACNKSEEKHAAKNDPAPVSEVKMSDNPIVKKAEKAHQKERFLSKEVVQFDFELYFGGKERLNGVITLHTNSTKGLITLNDGRKIVYNGDKVSCSPGFDNLKKVRFDAFTWAYFFLMPYKLSDPGTKWNSFVQDTLMGKQFKTQKLTFEANTGDAPDDWYIMYTDAETDLIDVVAYIVTSGNTLEKAEEDPHAIQYSNYQEVDGIPIAREWTYWEWREQGGLTRKLGEARVKNVQFIEAKDDYFVAQEVNVPK